MPIAWVLMTIWCGFGEGMGAVGEGTSAVGEGTGTVGEGIEEEAVGEPGLVD